MNTSKVQFINTLGILFATIIWGSTFLITKICLQDMDAIVLVGYRSMISAVLIALGLLLFKRNLFAFWRDGLILGFFMFLTYFGQTVGLKYVTASSSGFLTGLFVVIVPFFSCVVDRKLPTIQMLFTVVLALIGMWFITGGIAHFSYGDLLTILCAVAFSFYVLFADNALKRKADLWVLTFQQFFVAGIASFILAAFLQRPFHFGTFKVFSYVMYLAVFANVIAYVLQLFAQKYLNPTKIALLLSVEPVFAALFAWTLGNETFKISQGIGGLFIISAIIFSEIPILKYLCWNRRNNK